MFRNITKIHVIYLFFLKNFLLVLLFLLMYNIFVNCVYLILKLGGNFMGYIDLHIHSKYSDGKCSLDEILALAVKNNVSVISLTEHYNLSSLYPVRNIIKSEEMYKKIEVVPGIEIGTKLSSFGLSKNHVCHILAYYVSNRIYAILNEYEEDRKSTNERIIKILNDCGIAISLRKISNYYRNKSFGRYEIAKYLAEKGYVHNTQEAYSKYLDYGQMAHVERNKMSPDILIKEIIKCGGVPVIAHPKSLKLNYNDFEDFVNLLTKYGLAGIEIYNPRMKETEFFMYENICKKYNLIGTVGSDFHKKSGDVELGLGINNNLCVDDYSIIQSLKERKHYIDSKM